MSKFFDEYKLNIGEGQESPFMQKYDIYQDGTTPMYRDENGMLWAMSGQGHEGQLAMFCGSCLDDLEKKWPIELNFSLGHADFAFSGIRYPEGVKARGSVWPFGLYICPGTHRFFCFFHNETGWAGRGTAYDAFGLCEKPHLDSDFRHIGLMHSDDEGKTWTFDRWVLTANEVCFTDRYNPDAVNVIGQTGDLVRFGSGDFTLYVDDEYLYLFYDILSIDLTCDSFVTGFKGCDLCVARSRKRSDGVMGDFVKYYDGAFCEAGNFGRETTILKDAWHARVIYSEPLGKYIMTSKPIISAMHGELGDLEEGFKVMQICTSDDLIHWSEPEVVYKDGKPWGNHYNAIIPEDKVNQPFILNSNSFSILNNHNGMDVIRYRTTIEKK